MRVEVENGRIARVSGNAESAATRGGVCPGVRIACEQQSDFDRVLYPLRRTNPVKARGADPGWQRISWDEALDEIAERLMELRAHGESYRVAVAKGRSTEISGLLTSAFPDIYGTPNRFNHDSICIQAQSVALGCVDGVWATHDYDFEHARYLLLWGTDPISSGYVKSLALLTWKDLCEQAHATCIDPRLSRTAERAHEWLCLAPGTDGALACAIAHVILAEGLWNRAFVGDFVDDVNRFVPGERVDDAACFDEVSTYGLVAWWNEELYRTTPEWAADICGIQADVIRTVAHDFAAAGEQAVSWTSAGIAMQPRGLYGTMAAHALNGLVGSLGTAGGVHKRASVPTAKLPSAAPYQDETARAACAQPPCDWRREQGFLAGKSGKVHVNGATASIASALLEGRPYQLDTLIGYWCNFAFSSPDPQSWERAFAKLPFYVDITTHLSESSQFADIVLPARHHMFETWGLTTSKQGLCATLALEQPCVEAPGETRNDEAAVVFGIAQKMAVRGFPNLLAYYESIVDPVTGRAPQDGEQLAEAAVKMLTRPAWDCGGNVQSDWERFRELGIWNAPVVEVPAGGRAADYGQSFATPSGKFEFASHSLAQMVGEYAQQHGLSADEALASLDYEARGVRAWVPHYEAPVRVGNLAEFPLIFAQHRAWVSLEGRAANSPLFQNLRSTDPGEEPWDDVVKLNPSDMETYGLVDGDLVRIVSLYGSIQAHAKSWEGTRAGVAVKCYGQGHWAYGHVAALYIEDNTPRGGNNNELAPAVWERVSASTARHGGFVRVRIEKVPAGQGGPAEYEISAYELRDLIASGRSPLLIDCRNRAAYDEDHLPGALWNMMSSFDLGKLPSDLPKDAPIVAYCFYGWASQRVVALLREAGYANARSLRGGMEAWRV